MGWPWGLSGYIQRLAPHESHIRRHPLITCSVWRVAGSSLEPNLSESHVGKEKRLFSWHICDNFFFLTKRKISRKLGWINYLNGFYFILNYLHGHVGSSSNDSWDYISPKLSHVLNVCPLTLSVLKKRYHKHASYNQQKQKPPRANTTSSNVDSIVMSLSFRSRKIMWWNHGMVGRYFLLPACQLSPLKWTSIANNLSLTCPPISDLKQCKIGIWFLLIWRNAGRRGVLYWVFRNVFHMITSTGPVLSCRPRSYRLITLTEIVVKS